MTLVDDRNLQLGAPRKASRDKALQQYKSLLNDLRKREKDWNRKYNIHELWPAGSDERRELAKELKDEEKYIKDQIRDVLNSHKDYINEKIEDLSNVRSPDARREILGDIQDAKHELISLYPIVNAPEIRTRFISESFKDDFNELIKLSNVTVQNEIVKRKRNLDLATEELTNNKDINSIRFGQLKQKKAFDELYKDLGFIRDIRSDNPTLADEVKSLVEPSIKNFLSQAKSSIDDRNKKDQEFDLGDLPEPIVSTITDENGNQKQVKETRDSLFKRYLQDELLRFYKGKKAADLVSQSDIIGDISDLEKDVQKKVLDFFKKNEKPSQEDIEISEELKTPTESHSYSDLVLDTTKDIEETPELKAQREALQKPLTSDDIKDFYNSNELNEMINRLREKSLKGLEKHEEEHEKKINRELGGLANRGSWNSGTRFLLTKDYYDKKADRKKDLLSDLAATEASMLLKSKDEAFSKAALAKRMAQDFYNSQKQTQLSKEGLERGNKLTAAAQLRGSDQHKDAVQLEKLLRRGQLNEGLRAKGENTLMKELALSKAQSDLEKQQRGAREMDRVAGRNRGLATAVSLGQQLNMIPQGAPTPFIPGPQFIPGVTTAPGQIHATHMNADLARELAKLGAPVEPSVGSQLLGAAAKLGAAYLGAK